MDDSHLVLPLITLGDPGKLSGGYLYHRRIAEAAPEHGARIVFLSIPERRFPWPVVPARRVVRGAWSDRADAVLLDSIATAFAAPWLGRRPTRPLVVVAHQPPGGMDHGRPRAAVQRPLDGAAYARADAVIAASELLAEQLVAAGVERERIAVVPPGRDVAAGATSARVPPLRTDGRVAFLCVANWIERKGIVTLLDAFARLPRELAVLHLVGDDGVRPRYSARVRRRLSRPDLSGRVVVHGPVARQRMAALYEAADAFVLPASEEPYGTVYGEAMAAGLPVVGWDAGNLPHLAADGSEGLLVPAGDVAGLADALAALARDAALRQRLGERARRRAATRPTWAETAAAFFEAVRRSLR